MDAVKLTFIVENTELLDARSKATASFDASGGVIGSARGCDWILRDRALSVADQQVRVFSSDGHFAAEILTENAVFVNKAYGAATRGSVLRISDGDSWEIGDFHVSVFVNYKEDKIDGKSGGLGSRFLSMENIVPGFLSKEAKQRQNETEDLLLNNDAVLEGATSNRFAKYKAKKVETDPLRLLDKQKSTTSLLGKDPLAALDIAQDSSSSFGDESLARDLNLMPEKASELTQIYDPAPGQESIDIPFLHEGLKSMNTVNDKINDKKNSQNKNQDNIQAYLTDLADSSNSISNANLSHREGLELLEEDAWRPSQGSSNEETIDHVVVGPLLRAMGLNANGLTGPQADRLASEVGEALRTAIEGIMAIHNRHIADRAAMSEMHLHPVEDNPLRLEDDPQIAIHDLFLTQSPVHLRAGAAIEEGLKQILRHEEASSIAVESALSTTLKALEPERISKRFSRYRGHAPRTGDLDAWHWQMYRHYYKELQSDRQGGLGRMFREVFQQVYDREMRSRSLED